MEAYFVLRDRRLAGGVTKAPGLYIENTDENTSLMKAFATINRAAKVSGTLDTLFIFCHGFVRDEEDQIREQSYQAGGGGLELGKEGVNVSNVSLWSQIKNNVQNIVVYACGAADTLPGAEGTKYDGQYLMGALAIHTNANVFAADQTQYYWRAKDLPNGRYFFGKWDGILYQFSPDGASPTVVNDAPSNYDWVPDYLRKRTRL